MGPIRVMKKLRDFRVICFLKIEKSVENNRRSGDIVGIIRYGK